MMKKAGKFGWLVTGAMAAAFLWTVPAGAAGSHVKVEASSLFVDPQSSWARDIEFSDVLESPPTGRPRRLDHRNYIPMRLKEAGTVWVSQDRVKRLPDLVQGDRYLFRGTVDQFDQNYHVIVSDCVSESVPESEPAAETVAAPETEEASAEEKAAISETLLQVLLLDAQSSLDQLAQANQITVPELIAAQTDGGQSIAENIVADSMKGKDVGDNKTAQELMISAVLSLLQMQSTLKTTPQDADEIVDPPLEVATNAADEVEVAVPVAVEGPMLPVAEETETAAAVEDVDGPIIGNTPEAAALGATPEGPVESEELAMDSESAGEVLPLTDWTGPDGQAQDVLPIEASENEALTGEVTDELPASDAIPEGAEGTLVAEGTPVPADVEPQELASEPADETSPSPEMAAAVDLPGEEALPMAAETSEQANEAVLPPVGDSELAALPDAVATPEIPAVAEVEPEASLPTEVPDRLTAAEERKAAALARAEQRRAERQAELDAAAQKKAEEEAAREELARQKAEEELALAEAKRIAEEEAKAAEEDRKAELANQRLMEKKAKEDAKALRAAEKRAKQEAARAEKEAKKEQEEKARLLALQEKVEAEAALQAEQQKQEEEARLLREMEEQIRKQEAAAARAASEEEARLAAEKEQQAQQEAEAEAARLAEEAALQKADEEAPAQMESAPVAALEIPAEPSPQQEELDAEAQRQAEALLIAQGVSDQARRDAEANAARIAEEEAARQAAEERIQQMEREIKEMEAQTRQIEEERKQAELRRIQEEAEAQAAAEAEERQARLIEERERQAESIRVAQEVAIQARIDAEASAARIAEEEAARKAAEERIQQMEREIKEMEAQAKQTALVPLLPPVVAPKEVEIPPLPKEEEKTPPVDTGDLPEWMQPVVY